MKTVTSNNCYVNEYYVDEYERLIKSITFDEEHIDNLVDKIISNVEKGKEDNKKQFAFVAAAVAVVALSIKFFTDVNKKK